MKVPSIRNESPRLPGLARADRPLAEERCRRPRPGRLVRADDRPNHRSRRPPTFHGSTWSCCRAAYRTACRCPPRGPDVHVLTRACSLRATTPQVASDCRDLHDHRQQRHDQQKRPSPTVRSCSRPPPLQQDRNGGKDEQELDQPLPRGLVPLAAQRAVMIIPRQSENRSRPRGRPRAKDASVSIEPPPTVSRSSRTRRQNRSSAATPPRYQAHHAEDSTSS